MAEQRDFVGCYYGLFCDSVRSSSATTTTTRNSVMTSFGGWALEKEEKVSRIMAGTQTDAFALAGLGLVLQ